MFGQRVKASLLHGSHLPWPPSSSTMFFTSSASSSSDQYYEKPTSLTSDHSARPSDEVGDESNYHYHSINHNDLCGDIASVALAEQQVLSHSPRSLRRKRSEAWHESTIIASS